MSNKARYEPALEWFTEAMRKKLALPKNVAKLHWTEGDLIYLLERLEDEVQELKDAIHRRSCPADNEKVISEAADVANFAMMIADWVKS